MVPIRRFRFVLPAVLLAASCASADTLAAVNEDPIGRDELTALRPSYDDASLVNADQMRSDLTLLVLVEAVAQAAADQFGYELTESDVDERMANPPPRYASVLVPADQLPDINEAAVRTSAKQTLLRDTVVPELAKEEAGGFDVLLEQRPEIATRSCVRHITLSSEEEAEAVLERLDAGEDFQTLVTEVSLDGTTPDGLIATASGECLVWLSGAGVALANLAATAPLNTPVGPVPAQGQWEVIRVEDRVGPASAEELADDPMAFLDPEYVTSLYTPWLNDAIGSADIEVSPTVGRWSEVGVGIVAPGG